MPAGGNRAPATAAAGLLAAALALAGCGGSGSSSRARVPPTPGCRHVQAPGPKRLAPLPRPTGRLDPAHTYVARMSTSCGEIDIQLAVGHSPRTASSFAYLVRRGFYDGLTFHRISHPNGDFVIQGGDPRGDGSGGPGYRLVEAPPPGTRYTRGVVAMAKTMSEPAGASGSQFYIVTAQDAMLPPDYAVLGHVIAGDEILSRIAAVPTGGPTGQQPLMPVVIEKVVVQQS